MDEKITRTELFRNVFRAARATARTAVAATTSRIPSLNRDVCIAYNGTLCSYCVESCPKAAIRKEAFQFPVIEPNKCDGCGDCLKACQFGALEA